MYCFTLSRQRKALGQADRVREADERLLLDGDDFRTPRTGYPEFTRALHGLASLQEMAMLPHIKYRKL